MNAERVIRNNLKRKSEFSKTNRIRLDLFSFEKNEINDKNNGFSFSNKSFVEEKIKKIETKPIIKQISIQSQKTSNNSFDIAEEENSSDMSSGEENSSDMSCEEEEI